MIGRTCGGGTSAKLNRCANMSACGDCAARGLRGSGADRAPLSGAFRRGAHNLDSSTGLQPLGREGPRGKHTPTRRHTDTDTEIDR